jgi:hypothetical protein
VLEYALHARYGKGRETDEVELTRRKELVSSSAGRTW